MDFNCCSADQIELIELIELSLSLEIERAGSVHALHTAGLLAEEAKGLCERGGHGGRLWIERIW